MGKAMNVQVAQRLAELRRKRGYSQESLAQALGLSRQAVSKWERAESSPDTENLIALARLYGVSLDDLLHVDADIADDVAFEQAARAEREAQQEHERAKREAEREQERQRAEQDARDAQEAQRQSNAATAQALEAATQASSAAAQAAAAAAQASEKVSQVSDHLAATHGGAGTETGAGSGSSKGPWRSFPYATTMVALFLILVVFLRVDGAAAILVFFTIPIYRWIARILDDARRGPVDNTTEAPGPSPAATEDKSAATPKADPANNSPSPSSNEAPTSTSNPTPSSEPTSPTRPDDIETR